MKASLLGASLATLILVGCTAETPVVDQAPVETEAQTEEMRVDQSRLGKPRADSMSAASYDFTMEGEDPADMAPITEMVTGADFANAYPDRAKILLGALDLSLPELESVASANDLPSQMNALAAYYRETDNGAWLKGVTGVHDPGGFDDYARQSVDVLSDLYEFQSKTGRIARLPNGRIDWFDRGEASDLQWEIFLNRHFQLLPLLKQYAETQNPDLAAYIDATIVDWVTSNSPAAEASVDKQLPGVWRPMSSASRLLQVWPQVFYSLQDEPALTDAGRLMMLSSVPEQADHILRYHRVKHNHAVKEMIGLSHAAAAWPEFKDATAWKDYALDLLNSELDYQIYPDGVQKELAVHYHRTVIEYFLQYVEFMRAAGRPAPDAFEQRIEDMGHFLANVMRPTGTIPLNNDSDLDNVRDLVLHLADVFDRDDWRYIATNGEQGTEPDDAPSQFWGYAGQLVSRSGWGAGSEWSIFEVGPWGISHQHNDKLHLSVHDGRDLIVDTGRYIYKRGDPLRDYVIESRGHNIVFIDGADQKSREDQLERPEPIADGFGLESWGSWAVGSYDEGFIGVEGDAKHYRAVAHIPNEGWIVADWIETDRPRSVETQWHFHPEVGAQIQGQDVVSSDEGETNVRLSLLRGSSELSLVQGQMDPPRGWYSPLYNVIDPTPLATYTQQVDGNAINAFAIVTGEDVGSDINAQIIASDPETGQVSVRFNDTTYSVDFEAMAVTRD